MAISRSRPASGLTVQVIGDTGVGSPSMQTLQAMQRRIPAKSPRAALLGSSGSASSPLATAITSAFPDTSTPSAIKGSSRRPATDTGTFTSSLMAAARGTLQPRGWS